MVWKYHFYIKRKLFAQGKAVKTQVVLLKCPQLLEFCYWQLWNYFWFLILLLAALKLFLISNSATGSFETFFKFLILLLAALKLFLISNSATGSFETFLISNSATGSFETFSNFQFCYWKLWNFFHTCPLRFATKYQICMNNENLQRIWLRN